MAKKPKSKRGISWSEVIAIFSSITGFITSVIAWLDIAQYGQMGYQNFLWAGIVAAVVVWGIILWLLYKQKNIAFSIGLGITMVAVTIVGIWWTSNKKAEGERTKAREEKLVVLVVQFDGPEEEYHMRDEILKQLNVIEKDHDEIEIESINETITQSQGSEYAKKIGKEYLADIVVWGWYTESNISNLNLYVEKTNNETLTYVSETNSYQGEIPINDLETLKLQKQVGTDLSDMVIFLTGILKYETKDYSSALSYFDQIHIENNILVGQDVVYLLKGNSFLALKQYNSAIKELTQAIQLSPNLIEAYDNRAVCYVLTEQPDLADKDVNFAVEIGPERAYSYINRGNYYIYVHKYDSALEDFNKAIELQSNFPLSYLGRGTVYMLSGKFENAIIDFDKSLELNLDFGVIYNNRGYSYYSLKNYDKALADYNKAIEKEPHIVENYINRAVLYESMDDNDNAIKDYDKAVEINPDFYDAYINRGLLYYKIGRYNEAIQDLTQAIRIKEDSIQAHNNRGAAYYALGQYSEALLDCQRVIELKPDLAIAYLSCGNVEKALGNFIESERYYSKYTELAGQSVP